MPIPIPSLDTRRWADLVDEGRAMLPRYAPSWTDHNVHDPGITLAELLAWLIEQGIYRLDQINPRLRRKFLALAGIVPRAPSPAVLALGLAPPGGSPAQPIPAGARFLGRRPGDSHALPFESTTAIVAHPVALAAVLGFDGLEYTDLTRAWRGGVAMTPFGPDPRSDSDVARQPALYLGWDGPLPPSVTPLTLLLLVGHADEERRSLAAEIAAMAACRGTTPPQGPIPHHSARLIWEYRAPAGAWLECVAPRGSLVDETRALTLDGRVTAGVDAAMEAGTVGGAGPLHWLRARLAGGAFDAAPMIAHLLANGVTLRQQRTATGTLPLAPGTAPSAALAPGQPVRLGLTADADGRLTRIDVGPDEPLRATVVRYTAGPPGALVLDRMPAGTGSGLPEQEIRLDAAPVADGAVEVYTLEAPEPTAWQPVADFDAVGPRDSAVTLDAERGVLRFGDGARGRVVTERATVVVRYASTAGAAGTLAPPGEVRLATASDRPEADGEWNSALLGQNPSVVNGRLGTITLVAAGAGRDAESLDEAERRAAERLWAHERLLEAAGGRDTLDQMPRDAVLGLPAPERCVNSLDAERLALEVPGAVVRRARAWPGLDPRLPGLALAGTMAVVIVPELPRRAPVPSGGLLRAAARYLHRRRTLCQRIVVVGPEYVRVVVQARLRLARGAVAAQVRSDAVHALEVWLDPLAGGPAGLGWPFGRDVYRSEVLQLLDGVAGVDHVLELLLTADGADSNCGNVCVPPTALVASGAHQVEVAEQ